MYVYFYLSPPHESVIEVIMQEQHNFLPAEIEPYGCEIVYPVYMRFGIIHSRICIVDGKCVCVVAIAPLSYEVHLVHN